jgi:hypothetical protein
MSNYGQWRRWLHNQAALDDCATALNYKTAAAPPLERKIGRNLVRNLMQILVAYVDATLLQLTGESDSVVITTICGAVPRLPVRQLMPYSCRPAHSPRTCQTSPLIFKITRLSTGPSCRRPQSIRCGRLGVGAVGRVRVWCTDEVRRGPARGRGCQSRVVRTGRACRFTHGRHTSRR